MSAALLLFALGTPCLPEELGHLDPPPPPVVPTPPPVALPPPVPKTEAPRPAPPTAQESTLYRVGYGVLGPLGQIQIAFTTTGHAVRAQGMGTGSMFGMGNYEKRLESHLDARALASSRWVTYRKQGGKAVSDTVAQPRPGSIEILRKRTGKADEEHRFDRQQAVMDPLTFLYSLRRDPPRAARTFEVLDGRALWLISVEPAVAGSLDNRRPALVLRGRANPIDWEGKHDDERSARTFTIWLDNDADRTPLRLVMPLAVGDVRVELAAVSRPPATAVATAQAAPRPAPVAPAAAPARKAAPASVRPTFARDLRR